MTQWLLWFTGIPEEGGGNLTEETRVLVSLSLKVLCTVLRCVSESVVRQRCRVTYSELPVHTSQRFRKD